MNGDYDAIVIGSGIGGLSCAATLAKFGHRVLVLEQHSRAGGLSQSFDRKGFTWDVGLHYIGEVNPREVMRRFLDWLTGGTIDMAPYGPTYEIFHFPDDFTAFFSSPPEVLISDLKKLFPGSVSEIDRFFSILEKTSHIIKMMMALRMLPSPFFSLYSALMRNSIHRWIERTTQEVLDELITDPKLRSVLSGQCLDYGSVPDKGSFGCHAITMHHFLNGAYYPAGGGHVFADCFVSIIEISGGSVRLRSPAGKVLLNNGKVSGVMLEDGTELHAKTVVSAAGVLNTIALLPEEIHVTSWAREIMSWKVSNYCVILFLGLEGEIREGGAVDSNQWFYNTWNINDTVWNDPTADDSIPLLFISFPSLKDPLYQPGPSCRQTGQVITLINRDAFNSWECSRPGKRPEDYYRFKSLIEKKMLDAFVQRFPGLAPMIRYTELSTPLTFSYYTRSPRGSYGLEFTPRQFLSSSVHARTPIPGLYLAGQDTGTPGIISAFSSGLKTAAIIDRRVLWTLLRCSIGL